MASLLDPNTIATIRAEPETPVEAIVFHYPTSRTDNPECRLYYTPTANSTPIETIQKALNDPSKHPNQKTAILPQPDLIFNHGRRTNLDSTSLHAFTEGFARTQNCLSFLDLGSLEHRTSTFRSLMSAFPSAHAVGGRSTGSRSGCRAQIWSPVRKLILFTYPLIRDKDVRQEELLQLSSDVDVLFVIGDSDPLCTELPLSAIRAQMRARTWWIRVIGADHIFQMNGDFQAEQKLCNAAGQIAARWNVEGGRDPNKTELTLEYDKVNKEAVWTEWFEDPDKKSGEKPVWWGAFRSLFPGLSRS
jgi:Alpha/beta hydrolase domain